MAKIWRNDEESRMKLFEIIKLNEVASLNEISEEDQIAAVANDWTRIRYIKNPTKRVQLAAVENNWNAIYDILWRSDAAVITALKNPECYNNKTAFEVLVGDQFRYNALLMKKWLRYGEAMRNQQ